MPNNHKLYKLICKIFFMHVNQSCKHLNQTLKEILPVMLVIKINFIENIWRERDWEIAWYPSHEECNKKDIKTRQTK